MTSLDSKMWEERNKLKLQFIIKRKAEFKYLDKSYSYCEAELLFLLSLKQAWRLICRAPSHTDTLEILFTEEKDQAGKVALLHSNWSKLLPPIQLFCLQWEQERLPGTQEISAEQNRRKNINKKMIQKKWDILDDRI